MQSIPYRLFRAEGRKKRMGLIGLIGHMGPIGREGRHSLDEYAAVMVGKQTVLPHGRPPRA